MHPGTTLGSSSGKYGCTDKARSGRTTRVRRARDRRRGHRRLGTPTMEKLSPFVWERLQPSARSPASAFTATVATRAAPFTVRGREFEWWAKRKRAHHSVEMRVGGTAQGRLCSPYALVRLGF